MTTKREYSILPQGEKDDFHHHIRDGNRTATSQYMCMFTVITLIILCILAGIASLTASVFFPDQFAATFGHFWYSYDAAISNGTNKGLNLTDDSSTTPSWFSITGITHNEAPSGDHNKSTDYASGHNNKSLESTHHHHHHRFHHHSDNDGQHSGENSSGNYTVDENDLYFHTNTSGNGTSNGTDSGEMADNEEPEIINVDQLKEKFAEAMRDFEKHMENFTVRNPKLLVKSSCFLLDFILLIVSKLL